MVVGPQLDHRKPESVNVHEFPQPRPRRIVQAHEIAAVRLVPGEFRPGVPCAAGRLVEVVVDAGVLVALDEERVEPGTGAGRPLRRQVDVTEQLAVVRVVHVHRPQQLKNGRGDLREHVAVDRGNVIVKARLQEIRVHVAVDRGIVVRGVERRQRAAQRRLGGCLRVRIVERHPRWVRLEPPEDFTELELGHQPRREHQAGHRRMRLPHVILWTGTEGDLGAVQRAKARGSLDGGAVGKSLHPHGGRRIVGWIYQLLRKRADYAEAVSLEQREEVRVPVAKGAVEHRRLGRIDDPRSAVRSALQIAIHRGLATASV